MQKLRNPDAEKYRAHLFSGVPLYSTCLVHEADFAFAERTQVCSPEAVASLLIDYFRDKDREEFVVVLLDTANTVTGLHVVSVGGLAASIVEARQVFKAAFLSNAAALILAHNHPSGNPEPSKEGRCYHEDAEGGLEGDGGADPRPPHHHRAELHEPSPSAGCAEKRPLRRVRVPHMRLTSRRPAY